MPAESVDTFFACSLLVILVVLAMASLPKVLYPHIEIVDDQSIGEQFQQLAQFIMLNTGEPTKWGTNPDISPNIFGLAAEGMLESYLLDADKVTRLNNENSYAITYAQLLDALKFNNVALQISIQPFFETSIRLLSINDEENETNYNFEVTTHKSGIPVMANLSCYLAIAGSLDSAFYLTDSNGKANVTFTLSNSLNGTACLVVLAKAIVNPKIASFNVYSLSHNIEFIREKGTFLALNPLNHILNVSLNHPDSQIQKAYAFSHSYWANLTLISNTTQTADYSFPQFSDGSAIILLLTGLNDTESFVEWVAYPQCPLSIGVNFDASNSKSDVFSFTYVVTINSALYEMQVRCRKVG